MRKGSVVTAGLALAAMLASPVAAEVTSRGQAGFTIRHEGRIALPPGEAAARFVDIASWWSDGHTFSGDAGNMTITAQPGGCWCEMLPGGGFVRHMEVVMADPGRSLVLRGGLGPLLFMGASGAMRVTFEPDGEGARVTLSYAVGGYDPGGWADMPGAVDGVLADQFASFLNAP